MNGLLVLVLVVLSACGAEPTERAAPTEPSDHECVLEPGDVAIRMRTRSYGFSEDFGAEVRLAVRGDGRYCADLRSRGTFLAHNAGEHAYGHLRTPTAEYVERLVDTGALAFGDDAILEAALQEAERLPDVRPTWNHGPQLRVEVRHAGQVETLTTYGLCYVAHHYAAPEVRALAAMLDVIDELVADCGWAVGWQRVLTTGDDVEADDALWLFEPGRDPRYPGSAAAGQSSGWILRHGSRRGWALLPPRAGVAARDVPLRGRAVDGRLHWLAERPAARVEVAVLPLIEGPWADRDLLGDIAVHMERRLRRPVAADGSFHVEHAPEGPFALVVRVSDQVVALRAFPGMRFGDVDLGSVGVDVRALPAPDVEPPGAMTSARLRDVDRATWRLGDISELYRLPGPTDTLWVPAAGLTWIVEAPSGESSFTTVEADSVHVEQVPALGALRFDMAARVVVGAGVADWAEYRQGPGIVESGTWRSRPSESRLVGTDAVLAATGALVSAPLEDGLHVGLVRVRPGETRQVTTADLTLAAWLEVRGVPAEPLLIEVRSDLLAVPLASRPLSETAWEFGPLVAGKYGVVVREPRTGLDLLVVDEAVVRAGERTAVDVLPERLEVVRRELRASNDWPLPGVTVRVHDERKQQPRVLDPGVVTSGPDGFIELPPWATLRDGELRGEAFVLPTLSVFCPNGGVHEDALAGAECWALDRLAQTGGPLTHLASRSGVDVVPAGAWGLMTRRSERFSEVQRTAVASDPEVFRFGDGRLEVAMAHSSGEVFCRLAKEDSPGLILAEHRMPEGDESRVVFEHLARNVYRLMLVDGVTGSVFEQQDVAVPAGEHVVAHF